MSENSGAGVPGDGMAEALAAFAGCGMLVMVVRAAADVSAVVPRWKNARRLPNLLLGLILEVRVASLLFGVWFSCSDVLSMVFEEEDDARGRWGAE